MGMVKKVSEVREKFSKTLQRAKNEGSKNGSEFVDVDSMRVWIIALE